MQVLIITTQNGVKTNLPNLFGAARILANECDVLVVGHELTDVVRDVATYSLVKEVLQLDHANLKHLLAENIAPTIAQIVKNYTHVLIAADAFGKNVLPRVAGILEIGQISDVTDILSSSVFKKFMYAGNVLVELSALEDIKLLTIRTSNFDVVEDRSSTLALITQVSYDGVNDDRVKFLTEHNSYNPVDLSSAKIVVTGGRSLGSKEAFDSHIRVLAQKLNAGVGASRAAVEAGYANNDCQVGQTGKVVAPNVYLAIGISGAVQHISGMKDSKTVVAVNTDPNAAIFEHADYGLIGDLFEVVPTLINRIN